MFHKNPGILWTVAIYLLLGHVQAQDATYSGHGANSTSAEVIQKFSPPALDGNVSRKIQMMLDIRSPGLGQVSHHGKKLYFGWRVTGSSQVWRLDGPKQFPVQMTGGEDLTRLVDITPDSRYLILSRDRKGEENPGLYLQDTSGGPLIPIQHIENVQTFYQFVTDDSRMIYFVANDVNADSYAIYRYDLKLKTKEPIFSDHGYWRISDHIGEKKLLLLKATGALWREFYEFDLKTKTLTPLFGQNEEEEYSAEYRSTHPGELIVQTPKFGDFRRLYQWKNGKFTPITNEMKKDVSDFSIDKKKLRILYQINDNGYTRLKALDARTFKKINLPKFPEADHVMAGETTCDSRFTSLGVISSTKPQTNYVYDWKTKRLTQWVIPSHPEMDTSTFSKANLEYYPARDGTQIPMFVRRPKSCTTPCPVIVDFHGGPESQSTPGFDVQSQIFIDDGFIYVEPNVRGSDGYGKSWLHSDDGAKRLGVITDIEDCAKFIRSQWRSNNQEPKVGIMGASYGGYSTLIGMTMFSGSYDAGVANVGMSNLVTFLMNTAAYRRKLRISEYGDPQKDHDVLLKLSPITYLDQTKNPLMIIQGASDPRVPVGEAIQMYEALQTKHVPSQLIIFSDEGHGAVKRDNTVFELGLTLQFFKTHLKKN